MRVQPPLGNRFKPGRSGNPGGRPKISPELKQIRALTQEQVEELGELILLGNVETLETLKNDPSASVLKVCIASVALSVIERGDMSALNTLLDRLVGKIPTRYESDLEYKISIIKRVEAASDAEIIQSLPQAIEMLNSGNEDGSN